VVDKVPDREPLARPMSTTPAPALRRSARHRTKTVTNAELEAQRDERALRAAMAAAGLRGAVPDGARRQRGSERPATRTERAQTRAAIVPPAALAAAQPAAPRACRRRPAACRQPIGRRCFWRLSAHRRAGTR